MICNETERVDINIGTHSDNLQRPHNAVTLAMGEQKEQTILMKWLTIAEREIVRENTKKVTILFVLN